MQSKRRSLWPEHLTALKLDLRKPGFCLLRTFGKGEGTGKSPKTQVGWPRLMTETLVQRQDFKKVSAHLGHQRLGKVPCSMEEARTELTKYCSPVKSSATSCPFCLFMERVPASPLPSWVWRSKVGVYSSGPGRNSAKPTHPFSPLSKSENVLDQCPWITGNLQKLLLLVGWGVSKSGIPSWPREWRCHQQIILICSAFHLERAEPVLYDTIWTPAFKRGKTLVEVCFVLFQNTVFVIIFDM